MFTLRFDMRAPEGAAPATDLYAAAIDMCAWAETRGAVIAVLSDEREVRDIQPIGDASRSAMC